jgi:hypothetical protein
MIKTFLLLPCLLLAACSALAPAPTATPAPTSTSLPTATPGPTATATATPDIIATLRPVGTPAKEWRDIPIMPGALAGAGDERRYRFTTRATAAEIQAYYTEQLGTLGWSPPILAAGKTGSLLYIFSKEAHILTVAILPLDEGGFLVLLTQ